MIIVMQKLAIFEKALYHLRDDFQSGLFTKDAYVKELKSFKKELHRIQSDYSPTGNSWEWLLTLQDVIDTQLREEFLGGK